jgi:hypothetical protein
MCFKSSENMQANKNTRSKADSFIMNRQQSRTDAQDKFCSSLYGVRT